MNNFYQFASAFAFCLRFVCIALAIYGSWLVVKQFNKGMLQPIRRWLVVAMIFIGLSNIPVQFIHYNKLFSHTTGIFLSAFTAITNSLAIFIATLSLVRIIRFRIKQ